MGENEFTIGKGCVVNKNTGEEIVQLDTTAPPIAEYELSADEEPIINISSHYVCKCEFKCDCEFNEELFYSISNSTHATPTRMEWDTLIYIQKRYHKKKRINKKWIKRYGFEKGYIHCKTNANIIELDKNEMNFTTTEIQMIFPNKVLINPQLEIRRSFYNE